MVKFWTKWNLWSKNVTIQKFLKLYYSISAPDYHDPTIEDAYQQRTVIDTEPCLLDILDTAGQVEFTAMREQYMRCGEGFIICYSITDRHSFIEAEEYRNLILKVNFYWITYSYKYYGIAQNSFESFQKFSLLKSM